MLPDEAWPFFPGLQNHAKNTEKLGEMSRQKRLVTRWSAAPAGFDEAWRAASSALTRLGEVISRIAGFLEIREILTYHGSA